MNAADDATASSIESIERARADDDGILARALAGGDRALALRAALALGRTKRASAAALLVPELANADSGLRAVTTFSLGLVARPEDLERVRTLASDPSSAVRYASFDALGRIVAAHPALASDAIAATLLHGLADADATVRGHAAANLDVVAALPSARATAFRIETAFGGERSAVVRWHEMWVLYRAYAHDVDPHFLAAQLQSPDELVRVEALRAVAVRKDPGAAHFVRPLFADPSWRVQLQARETLHALAGEPATAHLTELPVGTNVPPLPEPALTPSPIPLPPLPAHPSDVSLPARPTPRPTFALRAPSEAELGFGPPLVCDSAASMDGPAPGPHPRVRLTTTRGPVVVRLYPEWAPVAVANFLRLTATRYFDGNRWFRVVPDFVHQTGDATNDADHEAGYTIGAEENPIEERSGVVAMGLDYENGAAVRDSAGTQFYVTDSPQLHLDRAFSVFGEIESGTDVLANLVESDQIVRAERLTDD